MQVKVMRKYSFYRNSYFAYLKSLRLCEGSRHEGDCFGEEAFRNERARRANDCPNTWNSIPEFLALIRQKEGERSYFYYEALRIWQQTLRKLNKHSQKVSVKLH